MSVGLREWGYRCWTWMRLHWSRNEKARELIADQHETGSHHDCIGGIGVAPEAIGPSPITHGDQNSREGQQLADLHPDIESKQIGQKAVGRDVVIDDFGRKPKAVE